MHESRGDAGFAAETLTDVISFDRFAGEDLDGDEAVERTLAGEPHGAHPALAEWAENVVLTREFGGEYGRNVIGRDWHGVSLSGGARR